MNTVTMATRSVREREITRETMELNLGRANEGTWLDLASHIPSKDSGRMWSSKRGRKNRALFGLGVGRNTGKLLKSILRGRISCCNTFAWACSHHHQ